MKDNAVTHISQIEGCIKNATDYLSLNQNSNGSFFSDSYSETGQLEAKRETIFFNAEILYQLSDMPNNVLLKGIQARLVDYLLSQRSAKYTFNYWPKRAKDVPTLPDDIDDTSCAVLALSKCLKLKQLNPFLSNYPNILSQQYVKDAFSTWIPLGKYPIDVDPVVQMNVSATLKLLNIELNTLPLDDLISENWYKSSKYYTEPFLPAYFSSRAGLAYGKSATLNELQRPTQAWGLGLSLLVNSEAVEESHIAYFLKTQLENGSWNSEKTIIEGRNNSKQVIYAKSDALATAIILNILYYYLEKIRLNQALSLLIEVGGTHKSQENPLLKLTTSTSKVMNFAQLLVLLPVLVSWREYENRPAEIKKIIKQSLSGLLGVNWLNRTIDKKKINQNQDSALDLMNFLVYCSEYAGPDLFRDIVKNYYYYQFSPPKGEQFLNNFKKSYKNRVSISLVPTLVESKRAQKTFSETTYNFFIELLAARSISDDLFDFTEDNTANLETGVTTLVKKYGYARAKRICLKKITSFSETALGLLEINQELVYWHYTLTKFINESLSVARGNLIAEKCSTRIKRH
ncbi:hypothetical protein BH11PAT4_BH11PAT4_1990 [soil metagenome]